MWTAKEYTTSKLVLYVQKQRWICRPSITPLFSCSSSMVLCFFFLISKCCINVKKKEKKKHCPGTQDIHQGHQHLALNAQLSSISTKGSKENKPKAFIHSNKVFRNKSFRSKTGFSHPSKVLAFLSRQMPHMRQWGNYSPNRHTITSSKLFLVTC